MIPETDPFLDESSVSKYELYCAFSWSVISDNNDVGGGAGVAEEVGTVKALVGPLTPLLTMLFHKEGGINVGTSLNKPNFNLVMIHMATQKWLSENLPVLSLSTKFQT